MKKIQLLLAGLLACILIAPLSAQTTSGNTTSTSAPIYSKAGAGPWQVTVTTTALTVNATSRHKTTNDNTDPVSSADAAVLDAVITTAAATVESGAVVTWQVTGKLAAGKFGPGVVRGIYTVKGVAHTVGPVNIAAPPAATSK